MREAYRELIPILCTNCGYCMPCLNGVEIPLIFQMYNEAVMHGAPRTARFRYRGPGGLKEEQCVDHCTECGECVEAAS